MVTDNAFINFWFAVSFITITVPMFDLGMGSVMGYLHVKKNPKRYSSLMYRSSMGLWITTVLALLATSIIIALHRTVRA